MLLRMYGFWLVLTCIVDFFMMGLDKWKAGRGLWRIPENTLLGLAALGGAGGGLMGMLLFRHKTRHARFRFGLPVLFMGHIALGLFLAGGGHR